MTATLGAFSTAAASTVGPLQIRQIKRQLWRHILNALFGKTKAASYLPSLERTQSTGLESLVILWRHMVF